MKPRWSGEIETCWDYHDGAAGDASLEPIRRIDVRMGTVGALEFTRSPSPLSPLDKSQEITLFDRVERAVPATMVCPPKDLSERRTLGIPAGRTDVAFVATTKQGMRARVLDGNGTARTFEVKPDGTLPTWMEQAACWSMPGDSTVRILLSGKREAEDYELVAGGLRANEHHPALTYLRAE